MHERTARIERVEGEPEGRFAMTLATEGEASDGDILSIKGGQIPARMPLLLSHFNDPTQIAGSVVEPHKDLKANPPRLRAIAEIELGGEGGFADVRRDVAFMLQQGHAGAVSIRWDEVEGGKPPVRRVNLSKDHPAFVDSEKETSWVKRAGLFWPEWRALEGSLVAIAADKQAFVDRSEATEGRVSTFWRAMADDAEKQDDGTADVRAALVALGLHAQECVTLGASVADIFNSAKFGLDKVEPDSLSAIEIQNRVYILPADAVTWIETLTNNDPPKTITVTDADRRRSKEPEADLPKADEELATDLSPADDDPTDLSDDDVDLFDPQSAVEGIREAIAQSDDAFREEMNGIIADLRDTADAKLREEFKQMLDFAQGKVFR